MDRCPLCEGATVGDPESGTVWCLSCRYVWGPVRPAPRCPGARPRVMPALRVLRDGHRLNR